LTRAEVVDDAMWKRIEPLLPSATDRRGCPFRNDRQIIEDIVFHYRAHPSLHFLSCLQRFAGWGIFMAPSCPMSI
jgi:transposase